MPRGKNGTNRVANTPAKPDIAQIISGSKKTATKKFPPAGQLQAHYEEQYPDKLSDAAIHAPVGFIDMQDYQLTTKQKLCALTKARTVKADRVICMELHISPRSLKAWKKEPEFIRLVRDEQNRMANEPLYAIHPLVGKAVGRYQQALDEGDMSLAVSVAKDVMDRAWGKPIIRQQSAEVKDIHIHFHDDTEVNTADYIQVDE